MANITSDAMKIALQLQIEGEAEVVASLNRVNTQINNAKAAAAQADFNMQKMKIEGKYDPDQMRRYEIAQLDELMQKYKLSAEFRKSAMDEIHAKHARAIRDLEEEAQAKEKTYLQVSGVGNSSGQQDAASREFVAERARLAKEVERIEEQSLSNRARLNKRFYEIQKQRMAGLIDRNQSAVLATQAREEYDAAVAKEAKILKAKQDSDDKQLASERAKVQKIIATIRSQQYKAREAETIRATKAEAAARREAVAIMHKWGTAAESAARDIAVLNARLADGTISATEYATAVDDINNKMAQMTGGAGRMGFMVGNLATGMEDFVTVISTTGFGMEGFSAATRAASNNVGQAVRSLGTGTAAMLAPMISIGVVLAGFAIPALYKWITAAEDAEKINKRLQRSYEALANSMTIINEEFRTQQKIERNKRDISEMKDPKEVTEAIEEAKRNLADIENTMNEADNKLLAAAQAMWGGLFTAQNEMDFNHVADFIGKNIGGAAETNLRDRMKSIKDQFNSDVALLGGEEARANLERNMQKLGNDINQFLLDKGLAGEYIEEARSVNGIYNPNSILTGGGAATGAGLALAGLVDDATTVDQIQAIEEEMASLDEARNAAEQEYHDALQERKIALQQILDLHNQMAAAEQAQAVLYQKYEDEQFKEIAQEEQKKQDAFDALQIQSQRNRLLGEENEAERRILDLALRRREIEDSGLAPLGDLENMFNAELEAIADDIEAKLLKIGEVTAKAGIGSEVEAYTAANRAVMEASNKDNTEQREMVQLLTAIKDHLANRQLLNVEIQ